MADQRRSPGPWWAGRDEDGGLVYGQEADPDTGAANAVVVADTSREDGDAAAELANAEFIARAANAHDAMLTALMAVQDAASTSDTEEKLGEKVTDLLEQINEAVAKAEGKS